VIFEVNLKLFGQQSAKKLLFVLRDFDDRGNNSERIMEIIDKDVKNIWKEIYKPDQYKASVPQDFFHFEFAMIPHKVYEEDKFTAKCKELRSRFDVGQPDTLFPSLESKNVPMDGLPLFIENTWEKIKTQKELNLPDQRIMVANLRCNELRDEALEKVKPQVQRLLDESSKGGVADFQAKCTSVLKTAKAHYEEFAHQYDKGVFEKVRKELLGLIMSQLFLCFDQQLKLIRQKIIECFDKELRRGSKRDEVSEHFHQMASDLQKKHFADFA